jgi:hypothetical protein
MNVESKLSGHWTDDELIASLYGVGPEDLHLASCADCRARLKVMESQRQLVAQEPELSFDFLAAQRRRIYARLTDPVRWWKSYSLPRWASVATALLILGGSVAFYEQNQNGVTVSNQMSDAQLAQDVSQMAQDSEPQSTAPLQALFVE